MTKSIVSEEQIKKMEQALDGKKIKRLVIHPRKPEPGSDLESIQKVFDNDDVLKHFFVGHVDFDGGHSPISGHAVCPDGHGGVRPC